MPGELQGRTVVIRDEREANKVHNRGYPGIPQSGGSLKLGLLEAAFLMDEKDFSIEGIDHLADLFHHTGGILSDFEVQYLVYRTLKLRGFFVKIPDHHFSEDEGPCDGNDPSVGLDPSRGNDPSVGLDPSNGCDRSDGDRNAENNSDSQDGNPPHPTPPLRERHFRLLPRGSKPSTPAVIHVLPIPEREGFSLSVFRSFASECLLRGVDGMIGIVDEDGDVTFYSVKTSMPVGDCPATSGRVLPAKLGQNRVVVPQGKGVTLLNERGFFGQVMGSMLHLSLIEALYLVECGKIVIDGIEKLVEFQARAMEEQRDIGLRYPVYRALRKNGVRVKTGFKYGTHFRAYSQDPDTSHADFLVHVLEDGTEVDWQIISRAIRVAHGVRKRILFTSPAIMETDAQKADHFLELVWTRP